MKKNTIFLLLLSAVSPHFCVSRGGDAAVGLVGGLAVGTMIGQASAGESRRSARAEQEAVRAQDKADRVKEEQERERISRLEKELERREMAQRLAEAGGTHSNMFILLMGLIVLLLFAVLGLSYMVFKKKS